MRDVLLALEELRTLSGNAQIECLQHLSKETPRLREVLEYTLDTHKMYKITELKYDKVIVPPMLLMQKKPLDEHAWEVFTSKLDYLAELKSAKNDDVADIKQFIEASEEKEFLKMVLYKDLRLGMDAKKCQKVWADFLFKYPYMGCQGFKVERLYKINYPAYAQTKMDGTFCNVIVDTEKKTVEYVSRQSKPQPMRGCFLDNFCDNWVGDSLFTHKFVLTGEVLVWDDETNKPLPRKLSNGILRRNNKTPEELDRIHFTCWDFIPYENFLAKRWEVPYVDRYSWLKKHLDGFMEKLHVVNTWVVNNVEEAMAKYDEQYILGEEGVVIKSFKQIWQDGKPSGQVKIKAEKDCELRMLSFQEGKGQYQGMCGNIYCESEDGLLGVFVKPRTPADAQDIWDNQDKYKHKILTVKFNEVIYSDTKEKPSLYLPVFVEVREDKNIADSFETIKEL